MSVTHNFKKRPSKKNLANRSLSFQISEIQMVKPKDVVLIDVYVSNGVSIKIKMLGARFIASIVDVGATTYKVLNF